MSDTVDPRPWRKRHPVLSRVVLFGIAAAVIGTLLFLKQKRAREDEITRLRGEVQAFDLLLTLDTGAAQVLEIIESKLSGADLPLDLRIARHRYEAMSLRRLVQQGQGPEGAADRIEAAFGQAFDLAADREARNGIALEWAESALEAEDVAGAREVLGRGDFGKEGPWGVLRDHYLAIAEALELGPEAGASRLEAILAGWEPPLALEPRVHAGGRSWNLPQVATITTERLARVYGKLGRDPVPLWVRAGALTHLDAKEQIVCCQQLMKLGAREAAARIWRRAVELDPQEAAAWAKADPSLAGLAGS